MPSFDIVSKTDLAEVDNAIGNVKREIAQRFDFKGSKAEIDREEETIKILADDDYKLKQIEELLKGHLTRRKVDARFLEFRKSEQASGNTVRQFCDIRQGIDRELGKRLMKQIKDAKLKVQVSVQGDELRVSGKKRDDLQDVIQLVKGLDEERPLQFVNMRD